MPNPFRKLLKGILIFIIGLPIVIMSGVFSRALGIVAADEGAFPSSSIGVNILCDPLAVMTITSVVYGFIVVVVDVSRWPWPPPSASGRTDTGEQVGDAADVNASAGRRPG